MDGRGSCSSTERRWPDEARRHALHVGAAPDQWYRDDGPPHETHWPVVHARELGA